MQSACRGFGLNSHAVSSVLGACDWGMAWIFKCTWMAFVCFSQDYDKIYFPQLYLIPNEKFPVYSHKFLVIHINSCLFPWKVSIFENSRNFATLPLTSSLLPNPSLPLHCNSRPTLAVPPGEEPLIYSVNRDLAATWRLTVCKCLRVIVCGRHNYSQCYS